LIKARCNRAPFPYKPEIPAILFPSSKSMMSYFLLINAVVPFVQNRNFTRFKNVLDFPLAFSLLAQYAEVGNVYSFSVSSVASASAVWLISCFLLFNTVFLLG
jgi:hypothetical protein